MRSLFEGYGIFHQGVRSVSPREAFELNAKGALLVDLRETDFSDFKAFDVPHVLNFPLSVIRQEFDQLPGDRHLIVADSTGLKSKDIVTFLNEKGFDKVASLAGGFVEWERDQLPVKVDINERLTGSCACQLKPRERTKE